MRCYPASSTNKDRSLLSMARSSFASLLPSKEDAEGVYKIFTHLNRKMKDEDIPYTTEEAAISELHRTMAKEWPAPNQTFKNAMMKGCLVSVETSRDDILKNFKKTHIRIQANYEDFFGVKREMLNDYGCDFSFPGPYVGKSRGESGKREDGYQKASKTEVFTVLDLTSGFFQAP